jgi:hypothetical protein
VSSNISERISEIDWAKYVVGIINGKLKELFPKHSLRAEPEKSLVYAYEINDYDAEGSHKPAETMEFKTDILIFEELSNERWKPRVVIETKIRGVTTHDAITYSKKAANHKAVHPYLRYGIFIGQIDKIPRRLIRHGENFDFMISWVGDKPSSEELDSFIGVIKEEVEASLQLDSIYGRKTKGNESQKFTVLHRPLVLKPKPE